MTKKNVIGIIPSVVLMYYNCHSSSKWCIICGYPTNIFEKTTYPIKDQSKTYLFGTPQYFYSCEKKTSLGLAEKLVNNIVIVNLFFAPSAISYQVLSWP